MRAPRVREWNPPPPDVELRLVAALRGITATQLARDTGIPWRRVARLLSGRLRPSPSELAALRLALAGVRDG